MKPINKQISTFLTSICSVLLSLLGFSCSSSPDDPDYPVMYGIIPNGHFEIKGTVTDQKGNDIEDAEIRVTGPDYPSYQTSLTAKTNAEGNYVISALSIVESVKVVCIPAQNNLEPDSVIVKLEPKDSNKGDSWNRWNAEATVNFILEEKK